MPVAQSWGIRTYQWWRNGAITEGEPLFVNQGQAMETNFLTGILRISQSVMNRSPMGM